MLKHLSLLRTLAAGFAVVLVLSYASGSLAQSGRRVRKSDPAPVSTPEPEPSPTPKPSSEKLKPRYTFLVGLDRYNGYANIPTYAYDGVLRSLVDRLDDSPAVQVGGTQSNMNRGDAIKMAKGEKEGIVVFVQLSYDAMRTTSQNTGILDDIVIDYSVFTPITAKVATSGRTYTAAQRNKGIVVGPRTSTIYGDRYLNQAAQEAADRILAYFRSHGPPTPPPTKQP
jgi:hypothetical protein